MPSTAARKNNKRNTAPTGYFSNAAKRAAMSETVGIEVFMPGIVRLATQERKGQLYEQPVDRL
jgi:hypothetical protein